MYIRPSCPFHRRQRESIKPVHLWGIHWPAANTCAASEALDEHRPWTFFMHSLIQCHCPGADDAPYMRSFLLNHRAFADMAESVQLLSQTPQRLTIHNGSSKKYKLTHHPLRHALRYAFCTDKLSWNYTLTRPPSLSTTFTNPLYVSLHSSPSSAFFSAPFFCITSLAIMTTDVGLFVWPAIPSSARLVT